MAAPEQFAQVVAASALAAAGVVVGAVAAARTEASPGGLSACVGGTVGIVAGTICFEMLPAFADAPLLTVAGALVVGFVLAQVVHRVVRARLPLARSFEEEEFSAFVLGATTEDLTEGIVLGLASAISWELFLFCAVAFFAVNALQGFSQGSVLRWWARSRGHVLTVAVISATTLVITACLTGLLVRSGALEPVDRHGMLALATGALLYVGLFEFGRNLEWNAIQRVSAGLAFVATAAAALGA